MRHGTRLHSILLRKVVVSIASRIEANSREKERLCFRPGPGDWLITAQPKSGSGYVVYFVDLYRFAPTAGSVCFLFCFFSVTGSIVTWDLVSIVVDGMMGQFAAVGRRPERICLWQAGRQAGRRAASIDAGTASP